MLFLARRMNTYNQNMDQFGQEITKQIHIPLARSNINHSINSGNWQTICHFSRCQTPAKMTQPIAICRYISTTNSKKIIIWYNESMAINLNYLNGCILYLALSMIRIDTIAANLIHELSLEYQ